ncbi:hypothetical protein QUF90_01060 [Desulfococcaceae bacterium HSG9]|nr:hypothetical protein [Desulfococcaceae bacterium HSG9]
MKNKKVKSTNFKTTLIWTIIVSVLFAELFVYTWCRVQCTAIGYEIATVSDNYQELTALKNRLNIELETLKSPERIGEIAKQYYDLAPPAQEQIILIH